MICLLLFVLLKLTNSKEQIKQVRFFFSATLNMITLSVMSFEFSKDDQPLPATSILICFVDFIQCLNHDAIL